MTNAFRVKISALAENDLIGIWRSIADHTEIGANRFLKLLDTRMDSLNDFPNRGANRPEFGLSVRILVEGRYVIIYRKIRSKVEILRVVHGSMDLAKLDLA